MISLIKILKEIYINEGGNVFKNTEYDTEDVLLNNIAPTIKKFTEYLGKLFPCKRSTFVTLNDKSNWLGSTGNKPQSGDVDLAYSEEAFFKDGKTFFVEFKTAIGKQSELQKYVESELIKQGFKYFLIRDLKEFQKIITEMI